MSYALITRVMRIKYLYILILFILTLNFVSKAQVVVNVCIAQPTPLIADAGNNIIACSSGAVIGGVPTASGGTLGYTYLWSPALGLSSTSISNPTASPVDTCIYTVTITDFFDCTASSSVAVFSNPLAGIDAGIDDTIEIGKSSQLNAIGVQNCNWSPAVGLSCTNCLNPVATPVETTIYYVMGTDEYDCQSSDSVTVFVIRNDETLYIPSSFSPNGNGVNDLFYVYGSFIKSIVFQIYDRWGNLIFYTDDIKRGWDGKVDGIALEGGVYVYTVKCTWMSGDKTSRNGIVTLLMEQ